MRFIFNIATKLKLLNTHLSIARIFTTNRRKLSQVKRMIRVFVYVIRAENASLRDFFNLICSDD